VRDIQAASDPWDRNAARLFLSDLSTNELAGIVVILSDVNVATLLWISLHDRKLAVPKFFDGFGLAIKILIVNLTNQDSVRVFLNQVDLAIEIPIAFCTSSELVGQLSIGIKRVLGSSGWRFWLQEDAAGVELRWSSV
jgi:hypothetical protein